MPSRGYLITLTDEGKAFAHREIDASPVDWRIEFHRPARSLKQNKQMWPMLADISRQVLWWNPETGVRDFRMDEWDWKNVLTASLRKTRTVPTIDYDGLVPLGLYTSEMDDETFAKLLMLIRSFGDQEGVRWSAPKWMEELAREYAGLADTGEEP